MVGFKSSPSGLLDYGLYRCGGIVLRLFWEYHIFLSSTHIFYASPSGTIKKWFLIEISSLRLEHLDLLSKPLVLKYSHGINIQLNLKVWSFNEHSCHQQHTGMKFGKKHCGGFGWLWEEICFASQFWGWYAVSPNFGEDSQPILRSWGSNGEALI